MAVTDYAKPLERIDAPEPELNEGYAVIEVLSCGVCFSDIKTSRGLMPYSDTLALPHIPGHEICGRVLAANPTDAIATGSPVVVYHYWPCGRCRRCKAGDENLCSDLQAWLGFTHDGGFRERLAVPLDRLFAVPPGITPVDAAPLTCAVGTAYRAVVTRGGVRPGGTVAVVGLGGVGIHALQIAAASGGQAIGLDTGARPLEVARELGLEACDAGSFDRYACGIPAVEEEGFDLVVLTAGNERAFAQATQIVRKGGRIVAVGYALGTPFSIQSPELALGEVEVVGSRYCSRDELGHAIELVRTGRIRTIVDSVRPLEQVNEAYDDLTAGRVVGRVVLDLGKS
jgi:D-arabinose 1-dehydrogenase-like Zn-dependent alcohol dehydrogenase